MASQIHNDHRTPHRLHPGRIHSPWSVGQMLKDLWRRTGLVGYLCGFLAVLLLPLLCVYVLAAMAYAMICGVIDAIRIAAYHRRLRKFMVGCGRHVKWSEVEQHLGAGRGTLIVERCWLPLKWFENSPEAVARRFDTGEFANGAFDCETVWWTPDDVLETAPASRLPQDREERGVYYWTSDDDVFKKWRAAYTDVRHGRAMLSILPFDIPRQAFVGPRRLHPYWDLTTERFFREKFPQATVVAIEQ